MRNASANRRPRGRNNNSNRNKGGNNRNQTFDSNGPEVRIRGTAHQITEKYEALAKDALSSGDTVLAESYLQHAEHYQRIVIAANAEIAERQSQHNKHVQPKENTQKPNRGNENRGNQKDDLALPASILGDGIQSESQDVRVLESA